MPRHGSPQPPDAPQRRRVDYHPVHHRWRGDIHLLRLIGLVLSLSVVLLAARLPLDAGYGTRSISLAAQVQVDAASLLPPIPTRHTAGDTDEAGPQDKQGNSREVAEALLLPATPPEIPENGSKAEDSDDDSRSTRLDDLIRLAPAHALAQRAASAAITSLALPSNRLGRIRAEDPPRLQTIPLSYPEDARRARIQGLVILRFVVETDGRVRRVEIVEKLHPICDAEAVRAILAAEFHPARQNGRKVPAQRELGIRFQLSDS